MPVVVRKKKSSVRVTLRRLHACVPKRSSASARQRPVAAPRRCVTACFGVLAAEIVCIKRKTINRWSSGSAALILTVCTHARQDRLRREREAEEVGCSTVLKKGRLMY
jgi:hypothetical protein